MRYHRYNIASMLGAILFVAVGFAALREADDLWDSGLFSLTLGLLLAAVLVAVHRTGARRVFWIGFALFGGGYLSLSLIPSTESRLITTKTLAYLDQARRRANAMRAVLNSDRMRAYNVSADDVMTALQPSSMIDAPRPTQETQDVVTWETRYNKPEQYGNIILKADPEGEILRLKDVARVEMGSSFYTPRARGGTTENFVRIGHSLLILLVGWLGGLLSRRLGRVPGAPDVSTEKPTGG